MRTNEERIAALHSRALKLERDDKNRQFTVFCSVSAAVCLAVLAGIASIMPRVSRNGLIENGPEAAMNASIFAGSSVLSYLVIAILAFLLGITVTVFCFRLKKWLDEKDRKDL